MKRQELTFDMGEQPRQKQPKNHDESHNLSCHESLEKITDTTKNTKRWTPDQDLALRQAIDQFGQKNWKSIAQRVEGRNHAQCLQRWNKVLKPGLVKGHWNFDEDTILERMVLNGCHSWGEVSQAIPGRSAKQCRERWRNHLDPSISKDPFSPEEDAMVQSAYAELGNRWTQIATLLPGRTDDAVKARWKILNPDAVHRAKPGRPKALLKPSSSSSDGPKASDIGPKSGDAQPPKALNSSQKPRGATTTTIPGPPAMLDIKTLPVSPKDEDLDVLTTSGRMKFLSLENIHLLSGWSDMYNPEETTEDFMITSGALKSFLQSQERANAELLVSLAHPEVEPLPASSASSSASSSVSGHSHAVSRRRYFSKSEVQITNQASMTNDHEPHHEMQMLSTPRSRDLPAMNSYYLSEPRQVQSSGGHNVMETALRGIKDEHDPLMLQSFKYYHQNVSSSPP